MRRVVVTGMGMVTPLGRDLESTWSALLAGTSGVGPITLFDARTFPTRIAAEVADFRLENYVEGAGRWSEHSRNSKFALAAASMAMKDSGLLDCKPELNRRRFGVYLGSGEGQQDFPTLLTREGGSPLTPEYAAPEQVTGAPITTATDVYGNNIFVWTATSTW